MAATIASGSDNARQRLGRRRRRLDGSVWRWGELNPRPMSCCQGFSGRSLRRIFSAPAMLQTAGWSGPSHQRVPFTPMTGVNSSGYLN